MHELYAYAGMGIYLTMWLITKENIEINYESKYEINYNKTENYATSEKRNKYIYSMSETTLYF